MLNQLKQAWKRDRLGVLGVGSAISALLLWALPINCDPYFGDCRLDIHPPWVYGWFLVSDEYNLYSEVQWIAVLFALAIVLLLLRRR